MSVVASLLVVVAVVAVLVGLLTASGMAYLVAAASSALAVVLLWRYLQITKDRTFVTDPPVATVPDFDRRLRGSDRAEGEAPEALPEVAIEDYDELMAAEILPSLETLSVEELRAVVARERGGLQRQGVIARAERLIDLTRGPDVDLSDSAMAPAAPRVRRAAKAPSLEPETAAKRTRSRKTPEKKPDLGL